MLVDFTLGCSEDSLKELYANSCDLNHNGLRAMVECTKLEKLEISINNFEEISYDLKSSLKILTIRYSGLTYFGLRAFLDCSRLEKLDGSCNNYEDMTEDFEFGDFRKSLIYLELSGLKVCSKKEDLLISSNDFGGIPVSFTLGSSKYSLRELIILNCNLKYNGLKAVTECLLLKIYQ